MATYIENLRARREAIAVELAAMDATKPGGLPDIKGRDGGTDVSHHQYKMGLYRELEMLDKRIVEAEAVEDSAPFEIETLADGTMTDLF